MPQENAQNLVDLFYEYEKQKSVESQLSKDLDLFDMLLQAFEYEKSEYERTNSLCDLQEFFSEKNLERFKNQEVIDLVSEVLRQRSLFLSSLSNGTVNCTQH